MTEKGEKYLEKYVNMIPAKKHDHFLDISPDQLHQFGARLFEEIKLEMKELAKQGKIKHDRGGLYSLAES